MPRHEIVSHDEWLKCRLDLLVHEKEATKSLEDLARKRRQMPWERVEQEYLFDTASGPRTLAELFEGRSQLIVYHFMFAPDWEQGCKSCSFWADNFNGTTVHLNQRDVTFTAISRAPLSKLLAYRDRMQWSFPWASSGGNAFNYDFHVSFTAEEVASGEVYYNYGVREIGTTDEQGISIFYRDPDTGAVYHTYSSHGRGIDIVNGAYQFLDMTPKGRDEDHFDFSMSWLRRHDQYPPQGETY
ncbi:thioredoxin family protein [Asticcacaulis sp. DXS10W]|uniref:Thioredoxin family protein n=1 Tax=Asticcacaulis currens TaxID=2984210 RepID=A0ABT5IFL0_9CAUL|nr:thioredoxin family protein [Asticcacaulis currens]MDC7694256.1 thioredoxin family protein [Asticcacaulis currens]